MVSAQARRLTMEAGRMQLRGPQPVRQWAEVTEFACMLVRLLESTLARSKDKHKWNSRPEFALIYSSPRTQINAKNVIQTHRKIVIACCAYFAACCAQKQKHLSGSKPSGLSGNWRSRQEQAISCGAQKEGNR